MRNAWSSAGAAGHVPRCWGAAAREVGSQGRGYKKLGKEGDVLKFECHPIS